MPIIHNLFHRPLTVMLAKRKSVTIDPYGKESVDPQDIPSSHLEMLINMKPPKVSVEIEETPQATQAQEPPDDVSTSTGTSGASSKKPTGRKKTGRRFSRKHSHS